MFYFNTTVDVN